jgi:hypothetical protein
MQRRGQLPNWMAYYKEATLPTVTPVASESPARLSRDESARAFLEKWARQWSAKDADTYFALYAKDFQPSYGASKTAAGWERQRRAAMARHSVIQVGVQVVTVKEKDGRASIRFWQTFDSKTFKSRVLKALDLVKIDGSWKIRRERLLDA